MVKERQRQKQLKMKSSLYLLTLHCMLVFFFSIFFIHISRLWSVSVARVLLMYYS